MKKYLIDSYRNDKHLTIFILVTISAFYAIYLIPDKHFIGVVGTEDGFFENLTAIFFLIASGFFLSIFRVHQNIFFLLLTLIFFFGFGEEISWGQRILGFSTPATLANINVQKEFTFHNIELFNTVDLNQHSKTGFYNLITINILFKIFWFCYGIILPLAYILNDAITAFVNKLKIPVPKFSIGIFFLLNYLIMKSLELYILPLNQEKEYYWAATEIYECGAALVFMIISYDFFKRRNTIFLNRFYN